MPDVKEGYSLKHAYKFYKEKHTEDIDLSTYRKICCDFNKQIVEHILKGSVVKIPHSLGNLWIKKIQTNWEKPRIDIQNTKKYGKKIYHLNEHSDGWWARWYWSKNNNLITNVTYYSFHPTRDNSRAVSAIMKQKEGHKRFFS